MGELKFGFALLAVLSLLVSWSSAQSDPIILFTGPKIIRAGLDYDFSVTSNNLVQPLILNFTLSGSTDAGASVSMTVLNQRLPANSLRNYKFATSTLASGSYSISYNAWDSNFKMNFQDSQKLTYRKKRFSCFIYTDKGMYKGGDTVNFSIFCVDSETKPFNPKLGSATIYNSQDIVIKSFANMTFVKGKFKGSFDLIDSPDEGDWRLSFDADDESYGKGFAVKRYVLPEYSVNFKSPSRVSIIENTFPCTIEAVYTFGEYVQGEALVSFYYNKWVWDWGWEDEVFVDPPMLEPVEEAPLEAAKRRKRQAAMMPRRGGFGGQVRVDLFNKTVTINSKAETFNVDIARDLQISSEQYVNVEVVFTEKLTGKIATAIGTIYIATYKDELVITGSEFFEPGKPYNFVVSAREIGTGLPIPNLPIRVDYSYGYPENTTSVKATIGASGSVSLSHTPLGSDWLNIMATSTSASPAGKYPRKPQVKASGVLDVTVVTPDPKVGSVVTIKVETSSKTIKNAQCYGIAKGSILFIRRIGLDSQSASFSITPTFKYAPKTEIICYFIDQNGSTVTSRVTLDFSDKLPNFVEILPSASVLKPGQTVTLNLRSLKQSTVAIFAQDKASKLLRGGNDFTKDEVMAGLSSYDEIVYNHDGWWWCWWCNNEFQEFENANCFAKKIVITNITEKAEPTGPMFFFGEQAQAGPPMGGEAAFDGESKPDDASDPVRKDFREVIDIVDVEVTRGEPLGNGVFHPLIGRSSTNIKVPDSITTFEFSAVAMNELYGMGLSETPAAIKIFKEFFIVLALPYSCKRNESVTVPITVYSYLSKAQSVTLTIARNDASFTLVSPAIDGWTTQSTSFRRTFNISSNSPIRFQFVIRPRIIGNIPINVNAVGTLASDSLEKPLKVIPEGIPKSITNSVLIMKNDSRSNYTSRLSCVLPPTAVSDTTSSFATVFGDLMGQMIKGLENLIQMSYGCGEQNLLTLAPSVFALGYLDATGQLTPSLRTKAIGYTLDGYQRQLEYRRTDGSFSAFGNSDQIGSTWLTAFTADVFFAASNYITVDPTVISGAFNYFVSKQETSGALLGKFREDGNVIHKDMQGGSSDGLAMTAFVANVLSKNLANFPGFIGSRNKALDYISANVDETDVYQVCISTLALHLGGHADFTRLYNIMISLADEQADQMSWSKPVPAPSTTDPWWWYQPRSVDIEMTAYALRVLADVDLARAVKIAKYLVSKKNAYGGYSSTQDTVQALSALSYFAVKFNAGAGTINLRLTPNVGSVINTQVNPTNMLTVQEFTLNPLARQLDIYSGPNSSGSAIVSLTCNFYENSDETAPRFNIRSNLRACRRDLSIEICVSYIAIDEDIESNMALLKLTLPSGYIYNNNQDIPRIIRLLELSDGDTTVEAYFDRFTSQDTCFIIEAIQQCKVEELMESSIEVSDYYNPDKKSQILYNVPENLFDCDDLTTTTDTTTPWWWDEPVFVDDPVVQEESKPELEPEPTAMP